MAFDKYTALWVSHSSIADFLKCPRTYFLRHVYKDKRNGHKITVIKPALALGQTIHDVVDSLSNLPVEERFNKPLASLLNVFWENIAGKKGGFKDLTEESMFKERAIAMIQKLEDNPGPLLRKAIKVKQPLPSYVFSDDENIILCGKIDWIEYLENVNKVHIIDFKTGRNEEPEDSLQLPIYLLLATNIQKREVDRLSYWYLESEKFPLEQKMPSLTEAFDKVMDIARRIKLARQINHFKCPTDGCFACRELERVVKGEGEIVGVSEYNQDIYILKD